MHLSDWSGHVRPFTQVIASSLVPSRIDSVGVLDKLIVHINKNFLPFQTMYPVLADTIDSVAGMSYSSSSPVVLLC